MKAPWSVLGTALSIAGLMGSAAHAQHHLSQPAVAAIISAATLTLPPHAGEGNKCAPLSAPRRGLGVR